jgi:hypothetical protein
MANQAIALQARAPQGNFLAPAIQQGAQMINIMSQQRAAERQAAAQQQQLDIARTQELRAAAKAPFELAEAEQKALTAQQKNTLGFYDLVAEGVKNSSSPDQVMIVADFLKKTYPGATQQIDQKLSDMPADPAGFNAWREKTMLQSLDAKDQLTKEFTTQNLGSSTRIVATRKFGGGAAEVVPGSEVDLGQEVTYVRGGDGSIRAMPKRLPVGGGGGGLVGGVRGGGAAGGVQMGQPIAGTGKPPAAAKPKAGEISPEKKLARDTAVQDLYNAIEEAQAKGHLVSEKRSYISNRAQELRQGRAYLPGGTEQKTSVDDIKSAATQLLRLFIEKGTSGTLNTKAEQDMFLSSVGGADSTYETRLKTIRNFAKQNGIKLNETAAAGATSAAPIGPPPPGVPAAEWKAMSPEDRKLWPR